MATPEEIYATAAADVFSAGGVASTFTPNSGPLVELRVNVEKNIELQPSGITTQSWETTTTLEYLLSDIGREAYANEQFTVGTITYVVRRVVENDGYSVTVAVTP